LHSINEGPLGPSQISKSNKERKKKKEKKEEERPLEFRPEREEGKGWKRIFRRKSLIYEDLTIQTQIRLR
jgi:hypothetical protein